MIKPVNKALNSFFILYLFQPTFNTWKGELMRPHTELTTKQGYVMHPLQLRPNKLNRQNQLIGISSHFLPPSWASAYRPTSAWCALNKMHISTWWAPLQDHSQVSWETPFGEAELLLVFYILRYHSFASTPVLGKPCSSLVGFHISKSDLFIPNSWTEYKEMQNSL